MTRAKLFCPYKGLQPYTEKDRDYFFGREEDQETIAANLVTAPLTILYGASGVGKTSVLQAGVVPFLQQLPNVTVVVFRAWQDRTFLSLLKADIARAVTERMEQSFSADDAPLDEFLAQAARATRGTIALILDQFEEYFLYHSEGESGNYFDAEFARTVNRDEIDANFLLSIREDSLARLDRFQGRIPNLFDNYLRIEHLDHEAARKAIKEPVEKYNKLQALAGQKVSFESELVDAVLQQVRTGQVILGETGRGVGGVGTTPVPTKARVEAPYMQLVMTRLWDEEMRVGSHALRLETLNDLGGAEQIVKRQLDVAMNVLTPPEQDAAARVFYYLVTPDGTKIAHTVPDLAKYAKLPQTQLAPVLVKLSSAKARILRSVGGGRYEIFHDLLAPAILDWRARYVHARERAEAEKQAAIEAAEREKETARQRELAQAQALAEEQQRRAEAERRRAEEQAGAARRLRRLAVALAVVFLLAVVAAMYARIQQQRAQAERDRAEQQAHLATSRQLAAQALTHLDDQLDLALLLSLEAYRTANTLEARSCLLTGLEYSPRLTTFLHSHAALVNSVAFSPDGQTLASGSCGKLEGESRGCTQGEIRLWDVATRQPLGQPLTGHTDWVNSVALSPDGQTLASGSADGTIILWDVATR